MADSYSTFLQVRLEATGAYNNTWGATLNSDVFQLFDTAITGWTTVGIGTNTAYSLPALSPGSTSVSRYFSLLMSGTPASEATITVPSTVPAKMYLINNQTGQSLVFTYAGSTSTVTVPDGVLQLIWCDGSNCWPVTANATGASSLGGVPAANWMRASRQASEITANTVVTNVLTVPTAEPYITAAEAPTTTLNCTVIGSGSGGPGTDGGNVQVLTLTGNRVMAAPINPADGFAIDLLVIQDGTGSRTLSWNAVFLFENGLTPSLATAPGAMDRFLMRYNAALTKWVVGHFGNISTGAGTTLPITVASNCLDWNLLAVVGTLGSAATINIVVNKGVVIEASTPGTPAMDLSGLISGCTVNLINLGYIQGKGGRGGRGAAVCYPGSGITMTRGIAGSNGGAAIKGPGSGCTFNVTNAAGNIWGGGGGGGGGGASTNNSSVGLANAGGGGAGAGGAWGGEPGLLVEGSIGAALASAGGDSTGGVNGAFGAAGAEAASGTGAHAQNGGAGGTWGTAGTAGTADTTYTNQAPAGAAGTAGNAIILSGGTVTFVSGSGSPNVQGAVS